MVHLRLNEKDVNPNPHINFITPLPSIDEVQEESRQLLRALAAQVKPVMRSHGFSVNSLEEYEYNQVFAGRNWNNGETVELVLRRPGGEIYPASWLMSTLCHELAHIKHMNHGPAFQALWKLLRLEVRQLQERGYYGDGYWSSGQRLADSARIPGDGIEAGDFPEYMCGGAQQRTRPTARRRRAGVPRGKRKETVPSLHTGRQTAKKRKAGARVTSKYAFTGEGSALGSAEDDGSKGKRAASNRAREERALAAERRIQALLGASSASTSITKQEGAEEEDDVSSDAEGNMEPISETDAERRQTLLSSKQDDDDIEFLGTGKNWKTFEADFDFTPTQQPAGEKKAGPSTSRHLGTIEIGSDDSDEDDGASCDLPRTSGSMSTVGQGSAIKKGKMKDTRSDTKPSHARRSGQSAKGSSLGLGKLVQTEIDFRQKESLGMAPTKASGRTLGKSKPHGPSPLERDRSEQTEQWSCKACTLINAGQDQSCSVCETPREKGL